MASDLDGKRQELLLEAVPQAQRIGAVADSSHTRADRLDALVVAAARRGVTLDLRTVTSPEQLSAAIADLDASGIEAVDVLASPLLFAHRELVFERMATFRLPAIYQWPQMAQEGGMMAYART
jgi:putative ABC transport system substrate-binding protein